jgi:hypothetical protein
MEARAKESDRKHFFFEKKKCFPASLSALRGGTAPTPALPQGGGGRYWAVTFFSKKKDFVTAAPEISAPAPHER